jgi:uncharacterized phage protein (TIGR01671 family)
MREIKFRAYTGGEIVYLDDCPDCRAFFRGGELVLQHWDEPEDGPNMWHDVEATFQQFTGLKDKNGKEIYEGDILQDNEYAEDDGTAEDVVVWNEADGCWTTHEWGVDGSSFDGCEVIGNVHENPELLTAAQGRDEK